MPSRETSMRNLAKARAVCRPPRPWRSNDEARMIRRFVFLRITAHAKKPSGRNWARQLGISHTWLQKLVLKFQAGPNEMWRLQVAKGDPKFGEFSHAQEHSRQMRERGELRLSPSAKRAKFFERYRLLRAKSAAAFIMHSCLYNFHRHECLDSASNKVRRRPVAGKRAKVRRPGSKEDRSRGKSTCCERMSRRYNGMKMMDPIA
jgi:hypothetical protein